MARRKSLNPQVSNLTPTDIDYIKRMIRDALSGTSGASVSPGAGLINNLDVGQGTGIVVNANDVAIDKASDANVRAAVSNKVLTSDHLESAAALVALTDAATVALDWDAGVNFSLTLGGNRTLGNPTNGQPGTWRTIYITQDGTGSRTLAYGNQYKFPGDIEPVLATAAAAEDLLTIYCVTATKFYLFHGGDEQTGLRLADGDYGDITVSGTGTAMNIDADVVDLAEMAHGTQGDILYYGASGAPTRLAAGTSGHFLKTNGAGANPAWADAVPEASVADYRGNTADKILETDVVWSAADYVALTDAATIAVDLATGINFSVTLGGNRTLGNPTNTKNGQTGVIVINQDATGSRTLAYSSNWKFAAGVAPTLSTGASERDLLFYQVVSSTVIYGALVKDVS